MKCQGNRLSRRNLLTVGAIGGLGLTLADFFQMREARAEQKHYDFLEAKAQSVIHIFLPGGMAHQESFDPKPYAPIEYRGELEPIKTNTGEVVLRDAAEDWRSVADKIAVIRSMTHGEAAHERGTHNMFTGYRPSPALQLSRAWAAWSATNTARGTTCRRTSAFRTCRTSSPAAATSARRSLRSASAPIRPTAASRCRT